MRDDIQLREIADKGYSRFEVAIYHLRVTEDECRRLLELCEGEPIASSIRAGMQRYGFSLTE